MLVILPPSAFLASFRGLFLFVESMEIESTHIVAGFSVLGGVIAALWNSHRQQFKETRQDLRDQRVLREADIVTLRQMTGKVEALEAGREQYLKGVEAISSAVIAEVRAIKSEKP